MPDLRINQNTRSFLYAEPYGGIGAESTSQSHVQFEATQISSQRSLSVWNNRSASAQNILLSNQTIEMPSSRLFQMPVQINQRRPSQSPSITPESLQFCNNKVGQITKPNEKSLETVTDTFQIFEEVIQLQKSQSFNRRCEKLIKLRKQTLVPISSNPFHSFGEDYNKDLDEVKSGRKLPRFTFNKQIETEQSTSSSDERYGVDKNGNRSRDKAVDSNKAIVTAYYVKKVLQKSLRSLEKYPKEINAKKSLRQMASEKHEKVLQLIAFNRLRRYHKLHQGHSLANKFAKIFFKAKLGRVYLGRWRNKMLNQQKVIKKLSFTTSNLRKFKLRRIFKSMRAALLQQKMQSVQYSTAQHIHTQRLQSKALGALQAFARYAIRARYMDSKCSKANRQRLEFKALKSWQRYVLGKNQKLDIGSLVDSLRRISLQRAALAYIKEFMVVQEHAKNLRKCAQAFRNLCLQRTTIRSLRQFFHIRKHVAAQKLNIRAFYLTTLKTKLFRFLHETNIEFIQHFVKVEDYFQRRKKAKNVMRVLYKHARIQQQMSSFNHVPTPRALYMIYLWLSGGIRNSLQKDTFSFGCVKKVSQHSGTRYRAKQRNADVLLQDYVQMRIIRAWPKHSRKTSRLRKRIETRLLTRVVDAWSALSQVTAILRKKAKSITGQSNLKMKVRLLRAFKMHASSNKRDARLLRTLQKKTKNSIVRTYFTIWFTKFSGIDKKRGLKEMQEQFKRKIYTRKCMIVWKRQFKRIQMKKSLLDRKKSFQREVTKHKFMAKWLFIFRSNQDLLKKGELVMRNKRIELLSKTWYALRGYKELKIRARHIREAMMTRYNQVVLGKCLNTWRCHAPKSQMKNALLGELRNDFRLKILSKVVKAFKLHKQYRKERNVTDQIMTRAVQEMSIKKFFRGWRSLTEKRMGLIIFEETFQKLRILSFFRRSKRMILHQNETKAHLRLLRDFLLLQKTFGELRRQRQRRDTDLFKVESFKKISTLLSKKHHFQKWREQFKKYWTQEQIAFYAVSNVQRAVLYKCFDALKRYQGRVKASKVLEQKLLQTLRKRSFFGLRKVTTMQRLAIKMADNREKATKQSFFSFWLLEMQEKRLIKDSIGRKRFKIAAKAMEALRRNTRASRQQRYMISQGQANNSFNLIRRVFYALCSYASNKHLHRLAYDQMHKLQQANHKRAALRALYQANINTKILQMIFQQVSLRTNRRIASDYLQHMRKMTKPRLLKYKACQFLNQKMQKISLRHSLIQWSEIVSFLRQMAQVVHQFDQYRRIQSLRKVFKSLKMAAKARRAKRNFYGAILEKSVLIKKQTIVNAFFKAIKKRRSNRLNKEVAFTYRHDRLRRSTYQVLRSHGLVSRRRKCLTGAAMFQRLVPKAFAILQMHVRMKVMKRGMSNKAIQMHQRKLIHKSLAAFSFHSHIRKTKKKMEDVAICFAQKELLRRAFRRLFFGIRRIKDTQSKRQFLSRVMIRWSNIVTVKTVFQQFKFAIQLHKNEMVLMKQTLKNKKMGHIFTAWQSLKNYNRRHKRISEVLQASTIFYAKKQFFNLWLRTLTNNLRLKIFFARDKQLRTMRRAFNKLRVKKNLAKAAKQASLWHGDFLKRAFFNAVARKIDSRQENTAKVTQMRSILETRLKTRVILGFRYNQLSFQGQKIIRQRLHQILLVKSLNALKYFTMSQRISRSYANFRAIKIRRSIFGEWRIRYVSLQGQKRSIKPLLQLLIKNNKLSAFNVWKKNYFRQRFLSTLRQTLLFTTEIATAKTCLQVWRKHAKFNKTKLFYSSEIGLLREYNSKRKIFINWFNATMRQAPVTLFCNKVQRAARHIQLRSSFQKVLQMAVYDQELQDIKTQLQKIFVYRTLRKTFQALRKVCAWKKLATRVQEKNQIALKKKFLYKWLTRYDKTNREKAELAIEEEAMKQAGNFHNEKLLKSCLTQFVYKRMESRQKAQADQYYLIVLKKRTFEIIWEFTRQEKEAGSLIRKANKFRLNHSASYSKLCYRQWRHCFSLRLREKKIVACFQSYTQSRRLSLAFAGMARVTKQSRLRRSELESKATTLKKRQNIRIKIEMFAVIAKWARQQQVRFQAFQVSKINFNSHESRLKKQTDLRKAIEFHSRSLKARIWDKWASMCKQESVRETETQRRSKMYSIFSGWKFFTKERSLLKRYLFECGESVGNVSQMTTLQLRDAATKRKQNSRGDASSFLSSSAFGESEQIVQLMKSRSDRISIPNNRTLVSTEFIKAVVETPNFMRGSLPEGTGLRMRHISPDVLLQSASQTRKTEIAKSAEQTFSRKKSNSVLSLLQKQFGDQKRQID